MYFLLVALCCPDTDTSIGTRSDTSHFPVLVLVLVTAPDTMLTSTAPHIHSTLHIVHYSTLQRRILKHDNTVEPVDRQDTNILIQERIE